MDWIYSIKNDLKGIIAAKATTKQSRSYNSVPTTVPKEAPYYWEQPPPLEKFQYWQVPALERAPLLMGKMVISVMEESATMNLILFIPVVEIVPVRAIFTTNTTW